MSLQINDRMYVNNASFFDVPVNPVKIRHVMGTGVLYGLRKEAEARGVQFVEVRTCHIFSEDIRAIPYRGEDGEIIMLQFDPKRSLKIDGPALVVIDTDGGSDAVIAAYSTIASDDIKVVLVSTVYD